MIDREDMIALIKAYESILNIISVVTDLTGGYTIDDDKYNGIYNIYDVIKRNSRYSEDGDEDDDPLQAVLNAINITAEEKYKLIKIGYDSENGADYGSNE